MAKVDQMSLSLWPVAAKFFESWSLRGRRTLKGSQGHEETNTKLSSSITTPSALFLLQSTTVVLYYLYVQACRHHGGSLNLISIDYAVPYPPAIAHTQRTAATTTTSHA
jgi:hypothetical protein